MTSQTFERLIRLEDEELDSSEVVDGKAIDSSCRVPMLQDKISATEENGLKHHQASKLAGSNLPGVHFTINGRHIQMNPDQLKYISLITLTVQSAALTLTMRAARTQKDQFSASVAVTVTEVLKLVTCIGLVWYEEVTMENAILSIKRNIINNSFDTLKVAVPSFVYYVQNNLLYVGSTHLDAATTQVTYQLKLLTTAIFSVLMLNKKLSKIQWAALLILFLGVALIETTTVPPQEHESSVGLSTGNVTKANHQRETRKEQPLIGFLAIIAACCLSGFAGVYFEKILKNSSHVSLWIRNIQLSVVAIPFGLIQVIIFESDHLATRGAFYGFTSLTWLCVFLQVLGGLLVAVVVKFANNILKGFATSLAIVNATILSMFLFNFKLTPEFFIGASLVIGSVMMYNKQ